LSPALQLDVLQRRRVRVRGRVQGVWFRASTAEEARRRGVAGWVCNRRDGSVEAVFEGPAEAVQVLLGFVAQGPPHARVDAVDVREEAPEGAQGFEVRDSR
jgi:acylphosphatase